MCRLTTGAFDINIRLLPYFALILAMLVWGAVPTITKFALMRLDALSFIVIRLAFVSILLLPFARKILLRLPKIALHDWIIFVSTVTLIFYPQTFALARVPVAWFVVVYAMSPILLAVFLRYHFSLLSVAAIVIAVVSLIYFLLSTGHSMGRFDSLGLFLLVISMLGWVGYCILIKKFHKVYSDFEITVLTCYAGAVVSIFVFTLSRKSFGNISLLGFLVGCSAGLTIPITFGLYSYAMRRCQTFAVFGQYLEPVFGVIIAEITFGRSLNSLQWLAVCLVLASTIIATHYSKA